MSAILSRLDMNNPLTALVGFAECVGFCFSSAVGRIDLSAEIHHINLKIPGAVALKRKF